MSTTPRPRCGRTSARRTFTLLSSRSRRGTGSSVSSSRRTEVRRSPLALRVVTAAAAIPIVFALDWLGGAPFGAAVFIVALVATFELCRMAARAGNAPLWPLSLAASGLLAVIPVWVHTPGMAWSGILVALLAVAGVYYLLPQRHRQGAASWAFTVVPVLYVGLLLGHLSLLREIHRGAWWVLSVLVMTWAYDTGAFFAGRTYGRRPFMHHVSPNKTWEGVFGGMSLCLVASLITIPTIHLTAAEAVLLGLVMGPVAQIGDLFESMLKRGFGVKDSGTVVPGHGGMLDRVDSLLFTGALAAYAALLYGYGP